MTTTFTRTLIAIAAGLGSAVAQAQAGPGVTIFGVMDAATEINKSGLGSTYRVVSGGNLGSRLGFRGSEDLGGGLSATFRLEMGINSDTGTLGQGGRAYGRESSVGLSSRQWGTLLLGRLPTPYYGVHNTVDAFAWVGSGGLPAVARSETASRPLLPQVVNARLDNGVGYTSNNLGGFQLRLMGSLAEGSTTIGRAYGASGRYNAGPIDAALGYLKQNGSAVTSGSGSVDSFVVGGSYAFGPAKAYAGFTNEKNSCTTCTGALARVSGATVSEFRLINLGLRYKVSEPATFIAQVTSLSDRSVYAAPPGNRNATWLALGSEYELSKRTLLYATVGAITNQNGSLYALGSGSAAQEANAVGPNNPRATTVQTGILHRF